MVSRRSVLLSIGAGAAAQAIYCAYAQNPVQPTSAETKLPPLAPSEQLMYSTVRLVNKIGDTTHWGTGFLFSFFNMNNRGFVAIVTNNHVVDGWDKCSFSLASRRLDGSPDLEKHLPIEIVELQTKLLKHPTADLVIIPVSQIINDLVAQGQSPFVITLDQSLILTDDELKQLLPVEQVLTVGYPGQLWDDVHNLPVFHRGYTATPPYISFRGKKEFLIDITTWPGSSGSPVFLYNEGSWVARSGGTVIGGIRAKLLGVVYGVGAQDVTGNVLIQNAPTQIVAPGRMTVPTNLGACISSSRVLEFEPLLVANGLVPPAGYDMRAH